MSRMMEDGSSQFSVLPGVTQSEILLGQSADLEGTSKALGLQIRAGLRTYFRKVNEKGGVYGRKIRLLSRNDSYDPDQAIRNARKFMYEDRIFAFVGLVGTTVSRAILPLASAEGIPMIGCYTGASLLRTVDLPHVVNLRASYSQEIEELVGLMADRQGLRRFAILYQDDSYGQEGLDGVLEALQRRGLNLVSEATYPRNTTVVKSALLDIRRGRPDGVIIIGAYEAASVFVKWASRLDFKPSFGNVSFVGGSALADALRDYQGDVYISQVVPYPWDTRVPLIKQYQEDIQTYGDEEAQLGFVSLEGYLVGMLVVEILQRTGRDLSRQKFLDALYEQGEVRLEDLLLRYGREDNQGSDEVYLTEIRRGSVYPVAVSG